MVIDDKSRLEIDGDYIRLIKNGSRIRKKYKYYGILSNGVCILHNGEQKELISNMSIDNDNYDLYMYGKLYKDITECKALLLIKDNLKKMDIQEGCVKNTNSDKYIYKKKINENFNVIYIKVGQFNREPVVYNSEGEEIYSFEWGTTSSSLVFGHNGFIIDTHTDYEKLECLQENNRLKHTDFINTDSYLFPYAIMNTKGDYLLQTVKPVVVGKYFITKNRLVYGASLSEIDGCKINDVITSNELGGKLIYKINRSNVCVATDSRPDKNVLKNCVVINTDDLDNKIENTDVYKFNKTELNCIGLIDRDYISIMRLKDSKIFRVDNEFKTDRKIYMILEYKNRHPYIKIKLGDKEIYRYNGKDLEKVMVSL